MIWFAQAAGDSAWADLTSGIYTMAGGIAAAAVLLGVGVGFLAAKWRNRK